MIYLDNNASTRVFERVLDAMAPFFTGRYANPGSAIGREEGLDEVMVRAKVTLGRIFNCEDPEAWVITSGATESNNLGLLGAAGAAGGRRHLVVTAVEHPSVLEPAAHLGRRGYDVTVVPVSSDGVVDPSAVADAVRSDTLLVSVMTANNESGVVQPMAEIAAAVKARAPQVLLHTDATQAIGKVPLDLSGALRPVDLLSLSAHKFHGPKGVGALFVRDRRRLTPLCFGGGQEQGLRPGTENPAGAIGLATAAETVVQRQAHYADIARLRDQVETAVRQRAPGAYVLGARAPRLPNTAFICIPGLDAQEAVVRLAERGVAVSAGSTCHAAHGGSQAALAMGLGREQAASCLRISLSLETTVADIDEFLVAFAEVTAHRHAAEPVG